MSQPSLKPVSEMSGVTFDGVTNPYIPGDTLRISDALKLHRDTVDELDPVTFEVIRHALFSINEEHGATIRRVSGSPIAIYALDFNPSLFTEDGEFVYFGPYMQYMSGVTDLQVLWTLENRADNPGIYDGDMFIANDPWIGAAHQQDVILICPVFHGDELFCWVANCLHQFDIGGVNFGSFAITGESVYEEGIVMPPTKIVERGEIRRDIEDLYRRCSRLPDLLSLDFRAQIAGNLTARDRIRALIARYGAAEVKTAMKRVISVGEKRFVEKMAALPDGVWRDRTYVECARLNDRSVYPVYLTLKKRGAELTFENHGTAAQVGAMNCTYSGWRGSIMVALNQLLCWEQNFSVGGALRHVRFNPTPGTFTCASHPASVSSAPLQAMEISLYPTYNVLSKMMYPDPEMRKDIMCISGTSQFPLPWFKGVRAGEPFSSGILDPLAGAIGAFSTGDGITCGGQARTPICQIPNVEHTEHDYPLLFAYRKILTDSGGAGKFRGGLSGQSCYLPHKAQEFEFVHVMSGVTAPTSTGMMGGHPGCGNGWSLRRGTTLQERFRRSDLTDTLNGVGGEEQPLALRELGVAAGPDDAMCLWWGAAGGYGDPLDRDLAAVQEDLDQNNISVEAAENLYGAVVDPDRGTVNVDASNARRTEIKAARIASATPPRSIDTEPLLALGERLALRPDDGTIVHSCGDCGALLGPLTENYKLHCLAADLPIRAANLLLPEATRFVDHDVTYREYYCPGCGGLMCSEVVVDAAPPLRDIEILADERLE